MVDPTGIIQCHFTIKGKGGFGTSNTFDMTIHINESTNHESPNNIRNYTKKGLSPVLIYYMVREIEIEKKVSLKTKLFIDVDASAGFWDSIGMYENPAYETKNRRYKLGIGYEKVITFDKLQEYCEKKKEGIQRIIGEKIYNFTRSTRRSIGRRPSTRRSPSTRRHKSSRSPLRRSQSRSPLRRSRSRSPLRP
jgi:hypothetical protein